MPISIVISVPVPDAMPNPALNTDARKSGTPPLQ